jgi:hypothetical protein
MLSSAAICQFVWIRPTYNSKALCHQTLLEWETNKVAVQFALVQIKKDNVILITLGKLRIIISYYWLFIHHLTLYFVLWPVVNVFKRPIKQTIKSSNHGCIYLITLCLESQFFKSQFN